MTEACTRWTQLSDREAIGDALSNAERDYLSRHAQACPLCGREQAVYGDMSGLLADAPLATPVPQPQLPVRHWRAKHGWVLVAAAAALLLTLRFKPMSAPAPLPMSAPAPMAHVPATQPALQVEVDALVGEGVDVDGRTTQVGARLGERAVLFARKGSVCLSVPEGVRACLAQGGLLRIAQLNQKQRRLELLSGRLAAELAPQPRGSSFGVLTREGAAIAVGTAFSVEVPTDDGPVVTRVSHGVVRVESVQGRVQRVTAHQRTTMTGAAQPLSPVEEELDQQLVSGTAQQGPATEVARGATQQPAPVVQPAEKAVPQPAKPSPRVAPVVAKPVETAASLLLLARAHRARGDVQGALDAYRRLFEQHRDSREAHAARVAYAESLLSQQGQAQAALASFDHYLQRGGALSEEARFGRVRALRALQRRDEERVAIVEFIVAHPSSPLVTGLHVRLRELSVH